MRVVRTSDGSPQHEFRPGPLALPAQGTAELSSADEMNPLTASPPASSSEPQPEELPIELEEVNAPQSTPTPKVKTNMVAQEVRVKATGARPGKSEGERELFSEETSSVLVGQNGGVVCLSAAVAPGQLLLLTNEESKREVVAQVKRKRAHKPTSCYVELEFAEPAQRFWGREFSAATALLPKDARELEAAAMVFSAEAIADESGQPPAAPTPEEVQALRREVETLRGQAIMQTPAASEQAKAPAQVSLADAASAPAAGDGASAESQSTSGSDGAPDVAFTAESLPVEHDSDAAHLTATEQVLLPKPAVDFTAPRPKTKRSRRAKGSFTPGFREGALRLALLTTALVITAVGAAWYKHWIPWKSTAKKPSVSASESTVSAKTSTPQENQEVAQVHSESSNAKVVKDAPGTSRPSSSHSAVPPPAPASEVEDTTGTSIQPSASNEPPAQPVVAKPSPSATPAVKHSTAPPTPKTASDSGTPSVAPGVIVPPKLIKSVRAMATMDAVRDFETGSVVIDAVVGTEGKVESMNVLSGPPSLRDGAMQALKQYRYEPATRNGQPVPAHVTVTVRFSFEP